jgi:anaerobic selenocysteine-containing dehydrogenase
MTQIEIGNAAVCMALVVATLMIVAGWAKMPAVYKQMAVSAVLLFIGYQIIEFVLTSFVVIAK